MSEAVTFTIDGESIGGYVGQTILEAAEATGIYIPRLCFLEGLEPHGSCRVCVVKVNGKIVAACTTPISQGMVVESESEEVIDYRRKMIEMLFVEGNHYCMFCEKSGNCELQALAYRFGITAPRYPYTFPKRSMDATHPNVIVDRDRCILCGRCVRASREKDHKNVFQFKGRGKDKRIAVNADACLKDTNLEVTDAAAQDCPVGAILPKGVGFKIPVGERKFDHKPIGWEVEAKHQRTKVKGASKKPKIATTSLAGCFGCHMSILDIDERILDLADIVDFDRSPVMDFKHIGARCKVGIVEGGCANEENVRVLQEFRKNCDILISLGDCATMGGIPAIRNTIPLKECLDEAYLNGVTVYNPSGELPNDIEIPLLLDKVYPCHEVVKIDYHLPGCPPSADCIWETLVALLTAQPLSLPYQLIKYD